MTLQVSTGSKAESFYEHAGFKRAYIARRLVRGGGTHERVRSAEEE
jgi:hypothetical protein